MVYRAINGRAPAYIADLLEIHVPPRLLRSSSNGVTLTVPRARTKTYGDRAFSVAAPALWNSLPADIRAASSDGMFKKRLKTYLFTKLFN